ncbi:unnamed protein product [Closterium sp. Naga37s-1]|nr:unnamed protein product [Closterium sp. Naga37s-1]
MRQVDLARWCFTRFGIRPDRSTIGRVLKGADHWTAVSPSNNTVRVRGGAYPQLEQAMPFTHFIGQLNAAMVARTARSSYSWTMRAATSSGATPPHRKTFFGFRTWGIGNIRLLFLPPNTIAFTQPLDQGLIATTKARYCVHWLRAATASWQDAGATPVMARYRPNMRDIIAWLSNAWMNILVRTIQRCWWHTGCMPRSWAMHLAHVGLDGGNGVNAALPIDLDEDIGDEAPSTDPESSEARRYARAASEMLISYARATGITPRNLSALFEIKNPIIVDHMERASSALNLNTTPPLAPQPA